MQGLVGGLKNRRRYVTLSVLFLATAVSFADRSMLSITGSAMSKGLHLSPVALGYLFSAFGWAYAIGQVPGGWLVDCFGPRRVYIGSVLLWSVFVFLQGFVAWLPVPSAAVFAVFSLLFLMGLCEAPVFPANSRIVAAWFPAAERGTAGRGLQFVAVLRRRDVRSGYWLDYTCLGVAVCALVHGHSGLCHRRGVHPVDLQSERTSTN
jgi:MFS family permease